MQGKSWDELSPNYQKRLQRSGINSLNFERAKREGRLQRARGKPAREHLSHITKTGTMSLSSGQRSFLSQTYNTRVKPKGDIEDYTPGYREIIREREARFRRAVAEFKELSPEARDAIMSRQRAMAARYRQNKQRLRRQANRARSRGARGNAVPHIEPSRNQRSFGDYGGMGWPEDLEDFKEPDFDDDIAILLFYHD